MSVLQDKKILLIVTAGIAAYKAAYLVRALIKKGVDVQVVMTPNAKAFITPLTLSTLSKKTVFTDFYNTDGSWNSHVDLALNADYIIVAPATANSLAKMAMAKSDNLALAVYLSAKCPVFFAPAMDLDMYKEYSNQQNIHYLQQKANIFIPPGKGELASGLEGEGRMAEPEEIISFIESYIKKELIFFGKKILITAGPTYENLDPVRFIGNYSSGKMGFELAKAAESLGAEVTLISGPTNEKLPQASNINQVNVISAQQMFDAVFKYYSNVDVAIMAAAVADYRPKNYSSHKIKKEENTLVVELVKNPDILKTMGKEKQNQCLVGFALETNNEEENAVKKLKNKNLDLIVLNSLQDKGAGFKTNTNKITIIDKEEKFHQYPLNTKQEVAKEILGFIHSKL